MLNRLILLMLMAFTIFAKSQQPIFKGYSIQTENSKLEYSAVLIDHNHLIWIGTNEGLYQFNGSKFNLIEYGEKTTENQITSLKEDHQSRIWIGYESGDIAYIENNTIKQFQPEEGLPKKSITSITISKNNTIWFTTAGEGVYYFKNNRLFNINEDDGLNDNYAYCSVEDASGNLWIGTDQGIAWCRDVVQYKIIRTLGTNNGIPDPIVRTLKKDNNNNIWIGTQEKGVCYYDNATGSINSIKKPYNWSYGQINDLYVGKNELWIATNDHGLLNYNPSQYDEIRSYNRDSDKEFSKINFVTSDREGNLWVGSQNELIKTSGNGFREITNVEEKRISHIHSILCAKDGSVYFTPHEQIVKINPKHQSLTPSYIQVTNSESKTDISTIYEDEKGIIWFGTMGEGLYYYNPKKHIRKKINENSLIQNSSILSILIEQDTIWLATIGGVLKGKIKYNEKNNEIYSIQIEELKQQEKIGNYIVYQIFKDSKNRIWFASDGNGIVCFEGIKYKQYNTKSGLKTNIFHGITEDLNGKIWFSTANAGIYSFDGNKFEHYGKEKGLRDLESYSILSDNNGNIYIVNSKGLDIYNTQFNTFSYFGSEYHFNQSNPDLNSISKDSRGNIWIGTQKGLFLYNSEYKPTNQKPLSIIQKATLFSDHVPLINGAVLNHNQNSIIIDFSGVWYTDPERIHHRYFLEGYSKDWTLTKDNHVVFPALSPGKYKFIVNSGLGEEFHQSTFSDFEFEITEPFYDEIGFQISVLIILLLLVYYITKRREIERRKYETLENDKIKLQLNTLKNQVNPHFLFNSFNTLISIIETDPKTAVSYVETLSDFFRNVVNSQSKDLISLKEELEHSTAYYFLQKKRFGKNLQIEFNIDINKLNYLIPPLVLQLLLENAIKHNVCSSEFPLAIFVYIENDRLCVKNQIRSKKIPEASTKSGLQNIVDRYKLLTNDKVEINSTNHEFKVSMPILSSN